MEFHWVELRTLCNASESEPRVRRAFATAAGTVGAAGDGEMPGDDEVEGALEALGLRRERTRGQFGNDIVVLTCRLKKPRDVRAFWERLARGGPDVVERIREQLGDRLDEDALLHFRLDKQAAFRGRFSLGLGGDTIAVACKPRVYSGGRAGALSGLEEFLDGLAGGGETGE
jgi:RNA binding exosome subunit